jgi:hypothetical protein
METTTEIKKVKRVKKKKDENVQLVEKTTEKKALPEENQTILNEFPENGPNLVTSIPEFLSILLSFFIVGHKYVALQELENGVIVPSFFILLGKEERESELECQFVKHKNTRDEDGQIHVQPLWGESWIKKTIRSNVVWNCIPFDENRDYHYIVK